MPYIFKKGELEDYKQELKIERVENGFVLSFIDYLTSENGEIPTEREFIFQDGKLEYNNYINLEDEQMEYEDQVKLSFYSLLLNIAEFFNVQKEGKIELEIKLTKNKDN